MKKLLFSFTVVLALALIIIGLSVLHRKNIQPNIAQSHYTHFPNLDASVPIALGSNGSKSMAPPLLVNSCNIEQVNGKPFDGTHVKVGGGIMEMSGWLIDTSSRTVPKSAYIRFEHSSTNQIWRAPIHTGHNRPDVEQAHGNVKAYGQAGFISYIKIAVLPSGNYHVLLEYQGPMGKDHLCDNGRHVVVKA